MRCVCCCTVSVTREQEGSCELSSDIFFFLLDHFANLDRVGVGMSRSRNRIQFHNQCAGSLLRVPDSCPVRV